MRAEWDPNNENTCPCYRECDGMITVRGAANDDERPLGMFLCLVCAGRATSFPIEDGSCGSCGDAGVVHHLDRGSSHEFDLCVPCAEDAEREARAVGERTAPPVLILDE
jgi:hypothetical protein